MNCSLLWNWIRNTVSNLIIIPDGILHLLPFETLRPESFDGNTSYLIDQYGLSYAPSASVFMHLENLKVNPRSYRGILSFGNPFYEMAPALTTKTPAQDAGSFQYAGHVFEPLPYSEEEIMATSSFFSVISGISSWEMTLVKALSENSRGNNTRSFILPSTDTSMHQGLFVRPCS